MEQVQVPLTLEDVLHPQEEDFIVNNPAHSQDCHYLKHALLIAVNGRPGVEVLRDTRVDWGVEGVKAHGPDLAVFADVRQPWKRDVGTFHAKELGARALLVIEVTSPTTRSTDLDDKVVEYHKAGVPFYAIIDYRPELEQRQVHLLGYRATPEGYVRVPLDEQPRLWLEAVRLWLGGGGERAVCFDEHGQPIPDTQQLNRDAQKARQENADLKARLAELERQLQQRSGSTEVPPST
jgi:Uma2 family endonuclease